MNYDFDLVNQISSYNLQIKSLFPDEHFHLLGLVHSPILYLFGNYNYGFPSCISQINTKYKFGISPICDKINKIINVIFTRKVKIFEN